MSHNAIPSELTLKVMLSIKKKKKFRGVKIDSQLLFESRVSNFCKKARSKICILFQGLQTTWTSENRNSG